MRAWTKRLIQKRNSTNRGTSQSSLLCPIRTAGHSPSLPPIEATGCRSETEQGRERPRSRQASRIAQGLSPESPAGRWGLRTVSIRLLWEVPRSASATPSSAAQPSPTHPSSPEPSAARPSPKPLPVTNPIHRKARSGEWKEESNCLGDCEWRSWIIPLTPAREMTFTQKGPRAVTLDSPGTQGGREVLFSCCIWFPASSLVLTH